jgi:Fe-S-cluster-containing hydrogenase component 2
MRIVFRSDRCTNCGDCVRVCAQINGTARIRIEGNGEKIRALYCRQCAKPACIPACTYDAITRSSETNAIIISSDDCQACHACVRACPFHSIFVDDENDGLAVVCDLCGGSPACVRVCSTGALTIK